MKENLMIAMSGGTTTVINATLAGVIKKAQKSKSIKRILAGFPGINGILDEEIVELTSMSDDELTRLTYTPASGFIGTTRIKHLCDKELIRLKEVFDAYKIKYFLNIGGNGTIKQSMLISEFFGDSIIIAALPKTVDNDLGDSAFKKMYFTPGYPSCANYWAHKTHMFNQENLGAYSHDKVLIAQTFGRETGFLAACARLADPQRNMPLILLLPEDRQPFDALLNRINLNLSKYGRTIIIMSEGYNFDELGERYDPSGQIMYSSSETTAAQNLVNRCMDIGIQARHFIPGFDQRSDIAYTLESDLQVAMEVGEKAVEGIMAGKRNFLVSVRLNVIKDKIECGLLPFNSIKNFSRTMPDVWIDAGNFDVTDAFLEYLMPLVINQNPVGLPIIYKKLAMPLRPLIQKKLK